MFTVPLCVNVVCVFRKQRWSSKFLNNVQSYLGELTVYRFLLLILINDNTGFGVTNCRIELQKKFFARIFIFKKCLHVTKNNNVFLFIKHPFLFFYIIIFINDFSEKFLVRKTYFIERGLRRKATFWGLPYVGLINEKR